MITAVDTNVLLDIFGNDPTFGQASSDALTRQMKRGKLVICDVVWAELASLFPRPESLEKQLAIVGIEFTPMDKQSASKAGATWRKYRKQGGTKSRVVADFLVAAHATHQCDVLLTRDRGFYRDYFKKLKVIAP